MAEGITPEEPEQASDSPIYRTFRPADETAFRELNEEWVSRYFTIEARDREILENPRKTILDAGGEILIATISGRVVGCCALLPMGEGCFEVSKMTIAEGYRSRGLGRELLRAVIEQARRMGACRLYLETNRKLANAIRVYEAAGFTHVPADRIHASPYARADVFMEMILNYPGPKRY